MKNKSQGRIKLWRKISWIILSLFLGIVMFIPGSSIKADDNIITYDDKIKILEIEPGNQYLLGGTSTDEVVTTNSSDGHSVSITRMPMTKFISMVDEINGQYDVVVVGRKSNATTKTDVALKNSYTKGTPYRDYTNPGSQAVSNLPLLWGSGSRSTSVDGINMGEYYSENDITDKRAKEIINMINSGQLVYVDDGIFTNDSNKQIENTKLFKTFKKDDFSYPKNDEFNEEINKDWKSKDNFKVEDQSDIKLNSIVNDYNNRLNSDANLKRPIVSKVVKPKDDKNLNTAQLSNRTMNFNITMGENGKFRAKLFLDINADGLFKEKELFKTEEFTVSDTSIPYNLTYKLDNKFIGYLDWKIEITRVIDGQEENDSISEVKMNILGNSQYKALLGSKTIKVLQITPNNGDLINLSSDQNFKKLINDESVKNDYNLDITTIAINDANTEAKNNELILNGVYDMVILGFEDGSGVYASGYEDFNLSLIDLLERYVETGQSVMFTHDTMAPALAYDIKKYPSNWSPNYLRNKPIITGSQALTRAFRDYIGQARYPDPYRSNNITGEDNYPDPLKLNSNFDLIQSPSTAIDLSGGNKGSIRSIAESDLTKDKIIHDSYPNSSKYSIGTTLQGYLGGWYNAQNVKKINGAQISAYPFSLNDEINVATTHTQWFQLNLEDEDVVPWFNLYDGSNSTYDSSDSRNNYYTYSKGNITYSGTGHSGGFPDDELKLFVNTIVKAERGANHKPEIICDIPLESTNENKNENSIDSNKDYYFNVDASDLDNDLVDLHITINGNELSSSNINCNLEDQNGKKIFQINTLDLKRSNVQIKIPAQDINEQKGDITVVIDGKDIHGAEAETKEYILKPVNNLPNIKAEFVSAQKDPANTEEPINVKYNVYDNDGFTPSDYYGDAKDVAILLDTSNNMKDFMSQVKNGIRNDILNAFTVKDSNKDIRLDVIGYNSQITDGYVDAKEKDNNGVTIDYRNKVQTILDSTSVNENDNKRNLGQAIEKANEFLEKNGRQNSIKSILIIGAGDPSDSIGDDVKNSIKQSKYNILTLDINNGSDSQLKTWHSLLGGTDDCYFTSSDSNDINNNVIPKEIAPKLAGIYTKKIEIKNVKLNFNLGKYFTNVDGLTSSGNSDVYYKNVIDSVTYSLDLDAYKNNNIKYKLDTNIPPVEFSIKSKPQVDGNLGFSNLAYTDEEYNTLQSNQNGNKYSSNPDGRIENYLSYSNSNGIQRINSINIPVLKIKKIDSIVTQGIYKGIKDGRADIDETGTLSFAKDSIVTFASNITNMSNDTTDLTVTIDSNAKISEIPKVYKINGSNLVPLATFDGNTDSKTFTLNNFDSKTNNNIVVLYSIKLIGSYGRTYTNSISAGGNGIPAKVNSKNSDDPKKDMPDLF